MAEYQPLMIERARAARWSTRRPRVPGWGQQPVVQRPRASPPATGRRDARAIGSGRPRDLAGHVQPDDHAAGQATDGTGTRGLEARVLFRRRRVCGGSGPEDGLPVLAAAAHPQPEKTGTWRSTKRITATRWERQRRRRRALPRDLPAAVVRRPGLPAPDSYRLPPDVTPETACEHYLGQLERLLGRTHHASRRW